MELAIKVPTALRTEGRDWPADADTMIGLTRLDNLQSCIVDVLRRGVAGDLLEAGVWRGGASILMRAVLTAYQDEDRKVWLADSFQGLPKPEASQYPADAGDQHWMHRELAVSLAEVQARFDRYGLLDDRVRFLPGWFSDTLPTAQIGKLAVLRLDADMYQSTMEALQYLYPKLAVGGYIIIDDYALSGCRAAVEDYRSMQRIDEKTEIIDWTGVFWMKTR
jgi:O-methyltransferase